MRYVGEPPWRACLTRLNARLDAWFRQMFCADWEDYDLLS